MAAAAAALAQLKGIWAAHGARISRSMFAVSLPAAVLFFGHLAAPSSFLRHPEFTQSMQWCIITLVIVSTPTIGQTGKKGMERALGTITGGMFGLAAASTGSMAVQWLGIIAAAGAGEVIVAQLKRENTGRLLPATYIIVTASSLHNRADAWQVAVTRTSAILVGIVICFLLSFTWAPQAASIDCYRQLLAMLEAVKDMAQHSWALLDQAQQPEQPQQQGGKAGAELGAPAAAAAAVAGGPAAPAEPQPAARIVSSGSGSKQQPQQPAGNPLQAAVASMPAPPPPPASVQVRVQGAGSQVLPHEPDPDELAMRRFLDARNKLKDSLATATAEYLVGYACGRPVIVPALLSGVTATAASRPAVADGHHVPGRQLSAVAISLRHCCHFWWMLHKLLLDGLDSDSLAAIASRYPADMLGHIRGSSIAVLQQAVVCVQHVITQPRPCCTLRQRRHTPMQQQQQHGSSRAPCSDAMAAFEQLDEHMADLRAQLVTWRQIYIAIHTLKRQAVEQLQAGGSSAEVLFVTPPTPEAHLFMLQWHALHYILQQLERALEDLRDDLQQLLLALQECDGPVLE